MADFLKGLPTPLDDVPSRRRRCEHEGSEDRVQALLQRPQYQINGLFHVSNSWIFPRCGLQLGSWIGRCRSKSSAKWNKAPRKASQTPGQHRLIKMVKASSRFKGLIMA